MSRFTIRDVLWLTVVVGIAFSGIANSRQIAALAEKLGNAVSKEAAKIGVPLMARDSMPTDW